MDEYVFRAIVGLNETVALFSVEPFNCPAGHETLPLFVQEATSREVTRKVLEPRPKRLRSRSDDAGHGASRAASALNVIERAFELARSRLHSAISSSPNGILADFNCR
jgi:hypothetical protein